MPDRPASPDRHALFLDVDGTLLKIAPQPDDVRVPAPLLALLRRLEGRLQGALALISGRAIDDLDRLFSPLILPAAGVHGLERRAADGAVHRTSSTDRLAALRPPLHQFAGARQGLSVEDKRHSLALHYRSAPEYEAEAETFLRGLIDDNSSSLELKRGKMVLEVMPGGANKGAAIDAFMEEAPFRGRTPVFIGDDVTDEDGFAAVNRHGGLTLRVGAAAETAAVFGLADEDAVFAWLESWCTAEGGGKAE